MSSNEATVVINEVEAAPLSDYVLDFLEQRKAEAPFLDFKLTMSIDKNSDFPEIAKDIFAFSNYGGGWLLIGWKEEKNNRYAPVGLPEGFGLDPANLQTKFNAYSNEPIVLDYKERRKTSAGGKEIRFGYIFIPPYHKELTPTKIGSYDKDGRIRKVFDIGDLFYRRGTQSIHPSKQEKEIMKKRLEKENYRLSLLSGEPDLIEEELSSNIFEVKKLPEYVYFGLKKEMEDVAIKELLKERGIFPEWHYKFREWEGKIVTFENLQDVNNVYASLVQKGTVQKENVKAWLKDADKSRLIMNLLDRELKHYAIGMGLYYNRDKNKLFYSTEGENRGMKWKAKFKQSEKQVAGQMYAKQLNKYIYCHPAFYADFVRLGDTIYLKVIPTFILTEDGKKVIARFEEGTIITKLSYDKHNDSYLNNIRFWIAQLVKENEIAALRQN